MKKSTILRVLGRFLGSGPENRVFWPFSTIFDPKMTIFGQILQKIGFLRDFEVLKRIFWGKNRSKMTFFEVFGSIFTNFQRFLSKIVPKTTKNHQFQQKNFSLTLPTTFRDIYGKFFVHFWAIFRLFYANKGPKTGLKRPIFVVQIIGS